MRYKLEAVLHESRNIAQENDHLRRDLESAREAYDYKMSEMHMKLTASDNNYRSAAERYTE
ncbi:MAG: hypothetical protein JST59_00150 [Actinobacteria bacterium]|nr:hypothetical protein [Actinomycetota bacterium]